MHAETDLDRLIAGMRPVLKPGLWVFATVPRGQQCPPGLEPLMSFRETEGITLIIEEAAAKAAGLTGTFPCRMITLEIHSALEAVGFMASIATRLAEAGLPVNPVAGFHHDHLFVPADRADEAMELLLAMTMEGGSI